MDAMVVLNNVSFKRSTAEDSLNINFSDILIKNVTFSEAASDAFDCDFCRGTLTKMGFDGVGGDALDVSGSEINITQSEFKRIRDKAISVGERSKVIASALAIENIGTGIASKDGSKAYVRDTNISNAEFVAFAAYLKKKEYEISGEIVGENITFSDNSQIALVEEKAFVKINGKVIKSQQVNVEALYENGPMSK